MASIQIPNLTAATSVSGAEQMEAVQGGSSVRVTIQQIADLAGSQYGLTPIPDLTLLGNLSGVSALPTNYTLSQFLDSSFSNTQGAVLYRGSSSWQAIAPGISGQVLSTQGSAADPIWRSTPGTGTVTSITAGTNLSATPVNPITASGTINTVMDPAFTTSVTTPSIYGGSSASQTLLIQSTTGVGTSDSIVFKVGNNGAITAMTIASDGTVTIPQAAIDTTSITVPLLIGGTTASSTLTLESTSGAGTSDAIIFKTGSQTERMRIGSDGTVGLGGANASTVSLYVRKSISGGTSYGIFQAGTFQSGVVNGYSYSSSSNIASGATLTNFVHYRAEEGTLNGTITNQFGFDAVSDLISATNNYGFRAQNTAAVTAGKTAYGFFSSINTATGGGTTYGFYANGTAPNVMPNLNGGISASSSLTLQSTTGVGTSDSILFKVGNNGATTAMTISSAGVVSIPSASITSLTTPLVIGGTTASSSLTLQSTSGVGTTDTIVFKTRNNGAVTALTIASNGNATFLSTSTTAIGTLTLTNALGATYGGTGQSTVTTGDLLYGSGTNTWGKLADVATGSVLVSGGVGVAPSYSSSPTISTSITSPIHYGGSAASSSLTLQSTSGAGTTDSIIFKVGNAGATTALTIGTGTSANFTFGGTAQRFLADFSNATVNSRFAFQASTTNASTGIYALPNGTSTAASWQATNAADPTNASKILMATNGTTDVQLVSGINGTGTYLPLSFYTNGSQQMQLSTGSQLAIGPSVSPPVSAQFFVSGTPAGVTAGAAYSIYANTTFPTTATTSQHGFYSSISGANTTGATTTVAHFRSSDYVLGSGQTVTNQYAFFAAQSTVATNNYGFYGNIAAATNNYNLYMNGTANNYFTGYSFGLGGVQYSTTSTATNTATLTATQVASGFIVGTPTATASYTLPLASALDTELTNSATGYNFEFVVFTTAAFAITLLTATGWTLVGSMATGATANSFARFRARKTGAGAWSLYRVS